MKTCVQCGKENPDEMMQCGCDGGVAILSPPLPLIRSSSSLAQKRAWDDQQLLTLEVWAVCILTFGSAVLVSIESLFSPPSAHDISSAKWEFSLIRQSGGLLLVWFLLKKRSKYFFDLGLSWSWMDAGWSVLLYFAATIAYYALFAPLSLGAQVLGLGDTPDVMKHSVPSEGGVAVLIFLSAMILNPFFEELIVRAYLMTTVKELTKSTIIIPILVSTLLQTSYHFYQGVPRALSEGAGFFIFSCFYAKTNRIAPLILAHLYMDLWAPFSYWMQSH